MLPPAAALERDIVGLGVAEKQTGRARQVFERSADQAGYFEHGKNRLVMPGVSMSSSDAPPPPPVPADDDQPERKKNKGGEPPDMDLHPFIQGLLKTLPEPETEWPSPARVKWLQTAANIFDLIYKGDGGGIVVSGARAERSPRPGDN